MLLGLACALGAVAPGAPAQPLLSVALRWDNDILAVRGEGAPPDYDYTQGLQLAVELAPMPVGGGGRRGYRFALGQRIYTPRRDAAQPIPGERPYAGWLYGLAPALGEPVQNGIHRLVGSQRQVGWAHQLAFEPAFVLRGRVRRPLERRSVVLQPYAEAGLGTLWSGVAAGAGVRAGAGDGTHGLYASAALRQEWVAHNLFLDGNTFRASVRAERREWVTELRGAVGGQHGHWALEYEAVLRTAEYAAQPKPHLYGALSLRWRR